MKPDENRPNRQSVRLKDYDYSQPGVYFVTICTDPRRCVFGDMRDGLLVPSTWGTAALQCWANIPGRWPPIELDQYILMPDHFHGLLFFPETRQPLPPLGVVVNWYKAGVTKEIRRLEGDREVAIWQRSYYEHIVRGAQDLERLREYILGNPGRWEESKGIAGVQPDRDIQGGGDVKS